LYRIAREEVAKLREVVNKIILSEKRCSIRDGYGIMGIQV